MPLMPDADVRVYVPRCRRKSVRALEREAVRTDGDGRPYDIEADETRKAYNTHGRGCICQKKKTNQTKGVWHHDNLLSKSFDVYI